MALYWQRWRIEDAYAIVKRLLGLAYFWVGSQNGVELQLWATWLLYAVLIDLTDAVAEALNQPFAALSLEMVYRNLYFFTTSLSARPSDRCNSGPCGECQMARCAQTEAQEASFTAATIRFDKFGKSLTCHQWV